MYLPLINKWPANSHKAGVNLIQNYQSFRTAVKNLMVNQKVTWIKTNFLFNTCKKKDKNVYSWIVKKTRRQ